MSTMTTSSAVTMLDSQSANTSTGRPDISTGEGRRHEDGAATRARIVRNIAALATGQLFTWTFTAALTVILPPYLGDQNLGKFSKAASLAELCGLLASLGITGYLVREVAQRGIRARSRVVNALVLRVPLTIGACGLAVTSAALLGYDALTTQLVYLLCLNVAFTAFSTVLAGALQGMQDLRPGALIGTLSKGLLLALNVVFLYQELGVAGVVAASNLSAAFALVAYVYVMARRNGLGGEIDLRTWREILIGSLPFFIWQAALMVYGQIDIILLSQFTSDAVVGWYSAAYQLVSIPLFVPTIVAAAVYPTLSRSVHEDPTEFKALAQRSLRTVVLLMVPIALGTMIIADRLIEFLSYPEEFRNSVPLIIVLASHMPMVGASIILGFVLFARDLQRSWALTSIAAAVLNPSLNMLLIPYFDVWFDNGAMGSAIATVFTELFMTMMALWLLRKSAFDRTDLMFASRCVAIGLFMAGVVWLSLDLFLPITVAIGATVYFTAAFATGTVSREDVRLLQVYARRRYSFSGSRPT